MGGFLRRLLAGERTMVPQHSRWRRRRPEVDGLERRELLYIPADKIILMARPAVLRPANEQFWPVTVSGSLLQSDSIAPRGFFQVTDQYRRIEPRGRVAMQPTSEPGKFAFEFTIFLQAQRGSQTPNGRQYNILVGGTDQDGTASRTIAVWVPQDAAHPRGPARAPRVPPATQRR